MKNILLIEDNLEVLNNNALFLKDKFNVTKASNVKEAKDALKNNAFDLIVLDLILPDGNGEEIFIELANKVPIIILSSIEDILLYVNI